MNVFKKIKHFFTWNFGFPPPTSIEPEYYPMSEIRERIARASFADKDTLEKACKQKIHPRCFEIDPQGSRCLVVLDQMPETIGQVVLAEQTKADGRMSMGQAWIVSAGPLAGQGQALARYPGGPLCTSPEDLVGLHIFLGAHSGIAMRFTIADTHFTSRVLMLADLDILAIDYSNNPMTAEEDLERNLKEEYGG